jgi:class 3 adenylate cyclase
MTLRVRLFLCIGLLLLAMTLAVYLIPSYLGEKRVSQVHQQAVGWLGQLAQEERKETETWLQESILGLQAELDAYLFLVYRTPFVQKALLQASENPADGWEAAINLMLYASHLDFLQCQHSKDSALVIGLGEAHLYPALRAKIGDKLDWLMTEADFNGGPYLGVLGQKAPGNYPDRCFLFEPSTLLELAPAIAKQLKAGEREHNPEVEAILQELSLANQLLPKIDENGSPGEAAAILSQWINQQLNQNEEAFEQLPQGKIIMEERSELGPISPYLGLSSTWGEPIPMTHQRADEAIFMWRTISQSGRFDLLRMLQELGILLSEGYLSPSTQSVFTMGGVGKFQEGGPLGVAVLSHDYLSLQPSFSGKDHYQSHMPPAGDPPIANQMTLVSNLNLLRTSLVNTLKISDETGLEAYLTVGASVAFLTWELAQHASSPAFAVYQGKIISGFGTNGQLLGPAMFQAFENYLESSSLSGINSIAIDGSEYLVSSYNPLPAFGVTFYTAISATNDLYMLNWITDEAKAAVKESSKRLLMVAGGVLVLALIVLEIIAKQVTKPISSLAAATTYIKEGQYDQVQLPEVRRKSRDEIAILTVAFKDMVRGLIDRERIRGVLNKAVSKEVADQILSQGIELGGEVKEAAVLFADIRNFTGLTEKMAPEEVIGLINEYMTWVSAIIDAHRGVIDKYIGDEVMAIYGAPLPMDHAALQAIATAIQLITRMKEWNSERVANHRPPVYMGIGVHFGKMVAGNMGGQQRQNYTVLGANVNLASRLCSEAKPTEILITESTYQQPDVALHILVEEHGEMRFKGFSQPLKTYRVLGFKDRQELERLGIRTRI